MKQVRYWIDQVLNPQIDKPKARVPMSERLQKGKEDAQEYNQRNKQATTKHIDHKKENRE